MNKNNGSCVLCNFNICIFAYYNDTNNNNENNKGNNYDDNDEKNNINMVYF